MVYCINSRLFTVTGKSVPPRLLTLLCPSVQYSDSQRIKQEGNQEGNKRHIFKNPRKGFKYQTLIQMYRVYSDKDNKKAYCFFPIPTYPVQA